MRKYRSFLGCLSILALVLGACNGNGDDAADQPEGPDSVRIGGMVFQTGPFSTFGEQADEGMQLGLEYVNSRGGVLDGAELEIVVEDTQSDQEQAIAVARRFDSDGDIAAVIGPQGTPDTLAMLPMAESLDVPLLSYGSTTPIDEIPSNLWRFSLIQTPEMLQGYMETAMQEADFETVGIIYDQTNPAQTAEAETFQDIASDVGYTVTGVEAVAGDASTFATPLDSLIATNPDALMVLTVTPANGQIMSQARSRGFDGQFVGASGVQDPATAEIAGDAASGYVTFTPFDLSSEEQIVQDFVDLFEENFPDSEVGTHTVNSFDAIVVLADAINRAGSADREAILTALGETSNVQTVEGPYSFDGAGGNTTPVPRLVRMTAEGSFETVATIEI